MGPKKWPKQAAFYTFWTKKEIYEELKGQRHVGFGCSISEESKQSLGLG